MLKEEKEIGNSEDIFYPTFGGRGQHHPKDMVGHIFRIVNPTTILMGDNFMSNRLLKDDLFLCINHSGDYFQNYIYLKEYDNCIEAIPELTIGCYGFGDSIKLCKVSVGNFYKLLSGKRVEKINKIIDQYKIESLDDAEK